MPRSNTTMARAKDVAGLFFLLLVSSAAQEILEPPENTTVFLNQTAEFRCEFSGGDVSWRVNGKPRSELTSIPRDDLDTKLVDSENGNPLDILTIIARAEYDGTTVQCLVYGDNSDQSENVSLRIQGPLSSVGDLTATSDGTSVTISWTPPFSLIPDIWYSVFIYNVTDENKPTVILCTNCTDITETHYTFTPDGVDPCHVYNFSMYQFSVVPLNGAGQGESSLNISDTDSVQYPRVTPIGNNEIVVHISTAMALNKVLMVMQREDQSPDVFRILLEESCNIFRRVPPSMYTVYFFDVENGLPNSSPNDLKPASVRVDGETDLAPDSESSILSGAKIDSTDGSIVTVVCQFKGDIEEASCVLVYLEYDNKTLVVVKEYPQSTDFPVTVTVDRSGVYTFAIFGKSSSYFDQKPVKTKRMQVNGTTPSSPPSLSTLVSPPERESQDMSGVIGGVIGALTVIIIAVVLIGVLVLITLRKKYNGRKGIVEEEEAKSPVISPLGVNPLPEANPAVQEEESKYEVVQTSLSVHRPSLPDNSTVQYQEIDIRATHKMARSEYAELGPLPTSGCSTFDEDTKTEGPYVTVLPHATTPVTHNGNNNKRNVAKTAPKGPPTVEAVVNLLWGVAGRWKAIALGLGFDEDHIEDEIFTNNSTDEACLQDCVEQWIARLQPSWEKLSHVLRDMGEDGLAQKAWSGIGVEEPQECVQWQIRSRQTSDSSSSGVVADASSESTDSSEVSDVVTGVEKTTFSTDGNNDDGNRGGKDFMPNSFASGGEKVTKPAFCAYPALQEEVPVISSESEDTTVVAHPTVASHEDKKVTIVSGTNVFDFSKKILLEEECHVFSQCEEDDEADFAQSPVSTRGSSDYHSESFRSGREKKPAPTLDNVKVVGMDFITGDVEVVAQQQSTDFSGNTGPEEADTTRGPFRRAKVVDDSLSMCVRESHQCAERFAVFPSLTLRAGVGMLVVGVNKLIGTEPSSDSHEKLSQPSVPEEETSTSQPLPAEPTPPQPLPLEVTPLESQENNPPSSPTPIVKEQLPPEKHLEKSNVGVILHQMLSSNNTTNPTPPQPLQPGVAPLESQQNIPPSPPPPPPHRYKARKSEKQESTPLKFLDPPGNFQENIVKWLDTGVTCGFHGPDILNKLCCGSSLVG